MAHQKKSRSSWIWLFPVLLLLAAGPFCLLRGAEEDKAPDSPPRQSKEQDKAKAEPAYAWKKTDTTVALTNGDKIVWQFNWGTDGSKPYFHPVALTDGTVLTWKEPPDHVWHYGFWFSWKYLNHVNYWEEDKTTRKSAGVTEWDNVQVKTADNFSATITLDLTYHEPDKPALLKERRIVFVSPPDADGTYCFYWKSTFTAQDQEVVIDRTPMADQEGGKFWGGYAGLTFRFARGLTEPLVRTEKGPVEWDDHGRYRAEHILMEYAGTLEGKRFGVLMLDSPLNLNHATPWYAIHDDIDWINPSPVCFAPRTMEPGDTLTLQYEVIVHAGQWDLERLKTEQQTYIGKLIRQAMREQQRKEAKP